LIVALLKGLLVTEYVYAPALYRTKKAAMLRARLLAAPTESETDPVAVGGGTLVSVTTLWADWDTWSDAVTPTEYTALHPGTPVTVSAPVAASTAALVSGLVVTEYA
jgi:hypothetical protein